MKQNVKNKAAVAPAWVVASPNLTGAVGGEIFLLPFFAAAPIAAMLLAQAFRKDDSVSAWREFLVLLYTALLGIVYVVLRPHWTSGTFALTAVVIFGFFSLALVFHYFAARSRRILLTVVIVLACLSVALLP
ncbi:MAG: hypothetical protein OER80_08430 [Gammaproteobacteria bacterium]|nr:hypothetical protein [Gammaproteobacteria bacterium]